VLILPHASGEPRKAANRTVEQLKAVGINNVNVCMPGAKLEIAPGTTAVFMTGGDQNRLVKRLSNEGRETLARFYEGGGLVGGTSAGAAAMSEIMMSGGMDHGPSPADCQHGDMLLRRGLALCGKMIVDTHFSQRERYQRLIVALAIYPDHFAIGLDEDTAVYVSGDKMEVFGAGKVMVYKAQSTSVPLRFAVDVSEYTHGSMVVRP
jgi:cyanophycinase